MGVFSSKKKIHVDTAVMRVVEDSMVPDSVLEANIESIFTRKPIGDAIVDRLVNSPFRGFEKMYRYAEAGNYFYGLPDARVINSSDGADQVKAAIESEVGQSVTIDYSYFRPINNYHMGWKALVEDYGYNPESNIIAGLSTIKGHTVSLVDLVAVYQLTALEEAEMTALGTWGTSAKSKKLSIRNLVDSFTFAGVSALLKEQSYRYGSDEIESVEIVYTWTVPAVKDEAGTVVTAAVVHEETIVISLASYDPDKEYFQARFTYPIPGGEFVGYWVYDPELGTYPEVDAIFSLNYTSPGTYFPFVVLRREKQNRAAPGLETSEEYLSTKKLLEFIDMDYQDISDKIHDNPDIVDVEQAVLMMGVPINTENPIEIDYLMRFFKNLEAITPFSTQSPVQLLSATSAGIQESHAIEIADADFRIVISYADIKVRLRAGSIGEVGAFVSTTDTLTPGGVAQMAPMPVKVFQRQINQHIYEEVRVVNPLTRYDIYRGKSVIGSGDDDRILVPLDYSITRQMSIRDREKLYFRSLHLVANSMVVEKVKWYQSSLFKTVLTIVAVVLTIASLGADGGIWTTLAAAATSATALAIAVLKIVLQLLIANLLIPIAAQELASILGPELTAIIAAAAMIYAGYKGFQSGEIVPNSTADKLLKVSSGLSTGVQRHMQQMFRDLAEQMEEFKKYMDMAETELEEARDLLGNPLLINPMLFTNTTPFIVMGESPTQLYARTSGSGNVGVRSFEIVQKFVDISLRLPTVEDSLKGNRYG